MIVEYLRLDLLHVQKDIEHIFYNLPLSLLALLFYSKFGFQSYGWFHVVLLVCWTVLIYSLDDWLDERNTRKLPPFYNFPLLLIAFLISPFITTTSVVGLILINSRALLKKSDFWIEEVESISEVLVFMPIFYYPIATSFPESYLKSIPVIYIIDKIHKLGHRETINRKRTIIQTIILSMVVAGITIWYRDNLPLFFAILSVLIMAVIPVLKAETPQKGWFAFQMWQAFAVPLIIYYVLFYFW